MDHITRKQAIADNLTWYYTGRPCKHGHVATRHTKSGSCSTCRDLHHVKFKTDNPTYQSTYQKRWRENNPHKYEEYYDKRHQTNGAAYLLQQVKARAKKREMEFDLELCDIVIPVACPVFGIPLFVSKGAKTDNSPSVDRIDNTKGYTKDNIQIISWKANRLKNNASLADLELLVDYLKRIAVDG